MTEVKDHSWPKAVLEARLSYGICKQKVHNIPTGLHINTTQLFVLVHHFIQMIQLTQIIQLQVTDPVSMPSEIPQGEIWMALLGLHHPCCHCSLSLFLSVSFLLLFFYLESQFASWPQLTPLTLDFAHFLPAADKWESVDPGLWINNLEKQGSQCPWEWTFTDGKQNPVDAFFYSLE